MNSKFFDLGKEKQDRMINAALKVFALNGYKGASTDDIVKEAGISKGLLFHYFTNKIGLYTFIYDYSARYMILELTTEVDQKETDFFEVYKQMETARMQVLKNYPYMQEFLYRANYEDVSEAMLAIEEKKRLLEDHYENIRKQIDYAALKEGLDITKLHKMIDLTIQGLMTEHFREGSFHAEMLYQEILAYLEMVRKLAQKE